jgi:hypothetical protein
LTQWDRTLRLVYNGDDDHVHERWMRGEGIDAEHDWADLSMLSGANVAPAGDPSAYVTNWNKTAHVVYRGEDNHIHELWMRDRGPWSHADLSFLTGVNSPAESNPWGYVTPWDSTGRVVYCGEDKSIHELWLQPGGEWHYANLSFLTGSHLAAADGPTAYVTPSDSTARVVWTGETDGHIHELWLQQGGEWHCADLGG